MQKALLIAMAVVAFGAALAAAQHPRHCEAPFELEAHAMQIDPKEKFFRRGHLAVDARNERVSIFEEVDNSTDREFFHTIQLFRERKAYAFNLKSKECEVRDIDFPFRPIHIPRDAHFHGEAIVGTNAFDGAGVLTTHWEHHNDTQKTFWFGVFTDRAIGCIPVMDHFHDERIGTVQTHFFDVVLGIADENQFIPEEPCNKADRMYKAAKKNSARLGQRTRKH